MEKIQKIKLSNGNCVYKFSDGHRSKQYIHAYDFSNNFGACKTQSGYWTYVDVDGNENGKFAYAYPLNSGLGLVQRTDGHYSFFNQNKEVIGDFLFAQDFEKGFAEVTLMSNTEAYMDILGNISRTETLLGKEAYLYYRGKVPEANLSDIAFKDKKFVNFIFERAHWMKEQALDLAETEEDLQSVKDYYTALRQYLLERYKNANELAEVSGYAEYLEEIKSKYNPKHSKRKTELEQKKDYLRSELEF